MPLAFHVSRGAILGVLLGMMPLAGPAWGQTTRPADASSATSQPAADADGTVHLSTVLTGGYETDPRDRGRPVVLVAAGLGVPTDVFRKAFSGVKPAPAGQAPEPGQVRQNKAALMKALAPYGVTNDRLDEVSNYYRYRRDRGELWTHVPASVIANVRDGQVVGFRIDHPGAGYSSPPAISVPGMPDVKVKVSLSFGEDLKTNGSIARVELVKAEEAGKP